MRPRPDVPSNLPGDSGVSPALYPVFTDIGDIGGSHAVYYMVSVRGLGSRCQRSPTQGHTRGIHRPLGVHGSGWENCSCFGEVASGCLHPHSSEVWAAQPPMPAPLCPMPRSPGSNLVPVASWSHPRAPGAHPDRVSICKIKPNSQLALQEAFFQDSPVTSSISSTRRVCAMQTPGLCPRPTEAESLGAKLQSIC